MQVLLEEIACKYTCDRELSCAMCGVLERGYCKLHSLDKATCLLELPGVIHYLAQQVWICWFAVLHNSRKSNDVAGCLQQSVVQDQKLWRNKHKTIPPSPCAICRFSLQICVIVRGILQCACHDCNSRITAMLMASIDIQHRVSTH